MPQNHTQPSILKTIVQDKLLWIQHQQTHFPLSAFQNSLQPSDRDFYTALQQGSAQKPAYILECKKASPSKGLIRANFNVEDIAQVYKSYASAISVLTDEKYFQGDFTYIPRVRQLVNQPILCKDFIVSEYQIYLARYYQADAILLMLSVLDDETYRRLAEIAHGLGMGILTETSNQTELTRAIELGAKVIGINNRDLHDLSVDIARTPPLARQIPADRIIISESGIYHHHQIQQLKSDVHGFLIGSSLMGSPDLHQSVRTLIFGENKVCGLTRPQDVQAVYEQGALYGGLIFAEHSPRQLSLRQAQELVVQAPLRFVGVFQNQSIDFIEKIVNQLDLFAVQLHGEETVEFIAALRQQLPQSCQIWKAISVDAPPKITLAALATKTQSKSAVKIPSIPHVDRYILDSKIGNQRGGTGQPFDWSKIPQEYKSKLLLAGGINPDNIELALSQHCLGLDLNSGVESLTGMKSPQKLAAVFNKILERQTPKKLS